MNFPENWNCDGALSYIWLNTQSANCIVSHSSAVNGNVSHYWNALNNLNCM